MSKNAFLVIKWLIFAFFAVLFSIKTFTFIDPDLGWHLRAGEMVLQSGTAPTVDPWNYLMPKHEWIDHEWLLDAMLWHAWTNDYWMLVLFAFIIIPLIPLYVWIRRSEQVLSLFFTTFAGVFILQVTGMRLQMISFLFYFLLYEIFFLSLSQYKKVFFYLLPFFFLVWANIHAGFAAGLACWGLILFGRVIDERNELILPFARKYFAEIVSFVFSTIATLCTPYQFALWKEILATVDIPEITRIAEWQPAFYSNGLILAFFLGSGFALAGNYFSRKDWQRNIPALFFLLQFLLHIRVVTIFLVTAIPLVFEYSNKLFTAFTMSKTDEKQQKRQKKIRIYFEYGILATTILLLFYPSIYAAIESPYRPPMEGIQALSHQTLVKIPGNIFNEYGMGGWLIYDNPHRKLFIDGRMPHWKDENDISALGHYFAVTESPEVWKKIFEEYDIHKVILGVTPPQENINDSFIFKILPGVLDKLVLSLRAQIFEQQNVKSLNKELLENDWCLKYSDAKVQILVAPSYCRIPV